MHGDGDNLNPVAWFIVKTEVEPVDLEKLQAAFKAWRAAGGLECRKAPPGDSARPLQDRGRTGNRSGCDLHFLGETCRLYRSQL